MTTEQHDSRDMALESYMRLEDHVSEYHCIGVFALNRLLSTTIGQATFNGKLSWHGLCQGFTFSPTTSDRMESFNPIVEVHPYHKEEQEWTFV